MKWWVYKCNSRNRDHQNAYGDWEDFFDSPDEQWGSTDWVPALAELRRGDMIIAYQTNRNELVGIARVRQSCEQDTFLYLDPIEVVRVKVRPLKNSDPEIAAIPAFQPGPIKTVYTISTSDAQKLLKAAKSTYKLDAGHIPETKAVSNPKANDIRNPPAKILFTTYRILRDTVLASQIKSFHGYKCQVCYRAGLQLSDGRYYAEAHHIRPLGSPHNGLDVPGNILCVCPNCHVLLDYGAIALNRSKLRSAVHHSLEQKFIEYHNVRIYQKR